MVSPLGSFKEWFCFFFPMYAPSNLSFSYAAQHKAQKRNGPYALSAKLREP